MTCQPSPMGATAARKPAVRAPGPGPAGPRSPPRGRRRPGRHGGPGCGRGRWARPRSRRPGSRTACGRGRRGRRGWGSPGGAAAAGASQAASRLTQPCTATVAAASAGRTGRNVSGSAETRQASFSRRTSQVEVLRAGTRPRMESREGVWVAERSTSKAPGRSGLGREAPTAKVTRRGPVGLGVDPGRQRGVAPPAGLVEQGVGAGGAAVGQGLEEGGDRGAGGGRLDVERREPAPAARRAVGHGGGEGEGGHRRGARLVGRRGRRGRSRRSRPRRGRGRPPRRRPA